MHISWSMPADRMRHELSHPKRSDEQFDLQAEMRDSLLCLSQSLCFRSLVVVDGPGCGACGGCGGCVRATALLQAPSHAHFFCVQSAQHDTAPRPSQRRARQRFSAASQLAWQTRAYCSGVRAGPLTRASAETVKTAVAIARANRPSLYVIVFPPDVTRVLRDPHRGGCGPCGTIGSLSRTQLLPSRNMPGGHALPFGRATQWPFTSVCPGPQMTGQTHRPVRSRAAPSGHAVPLGRHTQRPFSSTCPCRQITGRTHSPLRSRTSPGRHVLLGRGTQRPFSSTSPGRQITGRTQSPLRSRTSPGGHVLGGRTQLPLRSRTSPGGQGGGGGVTFCTHCPFCTCTRSQHWPFASRTVPGSQTVPPVPLAQLSPTGCCPRGQHMPAPLTWPDRQHDPLASGE